MANEEDALRAAPPPVSRDAPLPTYAVQSFRLENGLRVLVVERHGVPVVAAALSVDIAPVLSDDVGQRRAELLGATFLAPDGACSTVGCILEARGRPEELGEALHRIADRVIRAALPRDEYERRIRAATSSDDAGNPIDHNARAMLYGAAHPYGGPPTGAPLTWTELDRVRRTAFVPHSSTLTVVGDVTVDAVRNEAAQSLGHWADVNGPPSARPHLAPPHPSEHAVAMCANGGSRQLGVGLVAAGPAPSEPDAAPFEVLVNLMGGGLDSALFHNVREEMGIAYTVGASIQWFAGASMMTMRGAFDGADVLQGARAMLAQIAAVRDREPLVDELDRAKGTALAAWRANVATDQGIANRLAIAAVEGMTPAAALAWPEQLQAVTAAKVQAVAKRYLSQPALRIVFVGRPEFVGTASSLGLGPIVRTDFAGHVVQSAGNSTASRP
jgi:zinc protease